MADGARFHEPHIAAGRAPGLQPGDRREHGVVRCPRHAVDPEPRTSRTRLAGSGDLCRRGSRLPCGSGTSHGHGRAFPGTARPRGRWPGRHRGRQMFVPKLHVRGGEPRQHRRPGDQRRPHHSVHVVDEDGGRAECGRPVLVDRGRDRASGRGDRWRTLVFGNRRRPGCSGAVHGTASGRRSRRHPGRVRHRRVRHSTRHHRHDSDDRGRGGAQLRNEPRCHGARRAVRRPARPPGRRRRRLRGRWHDDPTARPRVGRGDHSRRPGRSVVASRRHGCCRSLQARGGPHVRFGRDDDRRRIDIATHGPVGCGHNARRRSGWARIRHVHTS